MQSITQILNHFMKFISVEVRLHTIYRFILFVFLTFWIEA